MDTIATHEITNLADERRWKAVLARDAGSDGAFVYAVRSTGVFCRPSCPSRRARRDRVEFFPVPEAALQAGYRACKRCRPETATPADPRVDVARRVCRAVEARADAVPTLAELGAEVGVSPHHLQRSFKAVMGISPRQYADAVRLGRVKESLRAGEPVAGALYGAGYGSPSRLYEKAPAQLGMTPASYARGGEGATIAFTIAEQSRISGLDRLLVAATERGVCMVALGDDVAFLEEELRLEFPAAELRRDDGALAAQVDTVLDMVEGAPGPTPICPSTCAPRPSSGRCGSGCRPSPEAKPAPTARLPPNWAGQRAPAPSGGPAPPTLSPWLSPATAPSAAMASCTATVGAFRGNRRSSTANAATGRSLAPVIVAAQPVDGAAVGLGGAAGARFASGHGCRFGGVARGAGLWGV